MRNRTLIMDSSGAVITSVDVDSSTGGAVFDGTNIWLTQPVSNSILVLRASTATVLITLTGNGMNFPFGIAFDGERMLVTNRNGGSVSLWKAADLSPLGSFSVGAGLSPSGVCSDGLNFWITLSTGQGNAGKLARF